jgi:hypothetical protein
MLGPTPQSWPQLEVQADPREEGGDCRAPFDGLMANGIFSLDLPRTWLA